MCVYGMKGTLIHF